MAVLSLSLSAAERSLADDHLETGITVITDFILVALSLARHSCALPFLSMPVLQFSLIHFIGMSDVKRRCKKQLKGDIDNI